MVRSSLRNIFLSFFFFALLLPVAVLGQATQPTPEKGAELQGQLFQLFDMGDFMASRRCYKLGRDTMVANAALRLEMMRGAQVRVVGYSDGSRYWNRFYQRMVAKAIKGTTYPVVLEVKHTLVTAKTATVTLTSSNAVKLMEVTGITAEQLAAIDKAAAATLEGKTLPVADTLVRRAVINWLGLLDKQMATAKPLPVGGNSALEVQFYPAAKGSATMDTLDNSARAAGFDQMILNGRQLPIRWQAGAIGKPVNIQSRTKVVDPAAGVTKAHYRATGAAVSDGAQLTITPTGATARVEAYYALADSSGGAGTPKVCGILNVVSYAPRTLELVVVPVNGASCPVADQVLADSLNAIYAPAQLTWTVRKGSKLDLPSLATQGHQFLSSGRELMSSYTEDMNAVIDAYKKAGGSETPYTLFLISGPQNGSRSGFMPYNRHFGFLFTDELKSDPAFIRAAAHELGHGAFNLRHPWLDLPALAKGSTANLLDYAAGQRLWKTQWDEIADPKNRLNIFADEEEMASSVADAVKDHIDYDKLVKWLRDNKGLTVKYRFKDFLSSEFSVVSTSFAPVVINIDKEYTESINGEVVTLHLKGNLSTKEGYVSLIAANTGIPLNIDFKNDRVVFNENIYFDAQQNSKGIAISLTTSDVEDFERLLHIQGYTYGDGAKIHYVSKYVEAFKSAAQDRNKIDILWENIPVFVAKEISDAQKWNDLYVLSDGSIDQIGTNEEKAVVNIVEYCSPTFLSVKINESASNSDFLVSVLNRLGQDYKVKFIRALATVLSDVWGNGTFVPSRVYIEAAPVSDDFRWAISDGLHDAKHSFEFGHAYFCVDKKNGWYYDCFTSISATSPVYIPDNFTDRFTVSAVSPIVSVIGEQDVIIPAFVAHALIKERNTALRNEFLSFNIGLLLPEVLIKPATLAKWSKFIKRGGSASNVVKANVLDDFIANVSKYDDILEKSASELTQVEKGLTEGFEHADDVGSFTQRSAQDMKYEQYRASKGGGTATKPWENRNIGTLTEPNQIKDGFCSQLEAVGAKDIRVNQSQTLANGNAVGINRPDIQFTYQGKRYYVEIDAAASNRGIPHKNRIISNDPVNANLALPPALQKIKVTINGKTHSLSGGITLIQL